MENKTTTTISFASSKASLPTDAIQSSYLAMVISRFSENRAGQVGFAILCLLVGFVMIGPIITPYDPITINPVDSMQPPSLSHPFGTDRFGRDILSRVMSGGRVSLRVGLLSVLIGAALGTLIGLLSGTVGGFLDSLTMRAMDLWFAFPPLLLALVVISVLGPGLTNTMLAVGFASVPSYARLVRGSVLSVREATYIMAARSLGCTSTRIAIRHILPNVFPPVIVLATFAIASAILTTAALSFLGLGAQPPQPEWGADLSAGRNYLREQWWISTFPGVGIILTTVSVNLLGDGLRDALDPRLRIE